MLSPYNAQFLPPGMGTEYQTTEPDLSGLVYGGSQALQQMILAPYALVSGAARDAGNTGFTTVLRQGLIMAQITASGLWMQFDNSASDGTQYARGILLWSGLNTQLAGANANRWMAYILVGGVCLYPTGMCLASTAAYGLAKTGAGANVRKHFMYSFQFSDDFMNETATAFGSR